METSFPSLLCKQTMLHRSEKFLFLAIQKLPVIRAFHVLWTSKYLWVIHSLNPSLTKGNWTGQEKKVKDKHFTALQFYFWSPIREPMASLATKFPKPLIFVPRMTPANPIKHKKPQPFLLKHISKKLLWIAVHTIRVWEWRISKIGSQFPMAFRSQLPYFFSIFFF